MSLINDALKRAKQSPPAASPGAPVSEPMRPVDGHGSVGLPRYFFPLLLCVFCGAFWFIFRGWDSHRQSGFYPEPVRVQARDVAAPTVGAPATSPASLSEAVEIQSIPGNRNFALDDEGGRNGAEASAPVTPAYRLQGIFYRPANPSALINTKTVYVGDQISGARVKAIDRQSVTLEQGGQTQVLTLQ